MFRVVPDQLKISDGWVRCGHCADVFDATLYLDTWEPPAPSTKGIQAAPLAGAAEATDEVGSVSQADLHVGAAEHRLAHSLQVTTGLEFEPVNAYPAAGAPAAAPGLQLNPCDRSASDDQDPLRLNPDSLQSDLRAQPEVRGDVAEPVTQAVAVMLSGKVQPQAPEGGKHHEPDPQRRVIEAPSVRETDAVREPDLDFQTELQRFAASTAGGASGPEPVANSVAAAVVEELRGPSPSLPPADDQNLTDPEPGFVRQARRKAFWHSSGMRALLSVLSLLLTLVLGLQWALHERDALAAWQPRWASTLNQLCAPLGCEVAPVRRIDAIVIDSSTLVRRLGNFYSFDLVLKNTAPVALAVPALELSLTDTRDAVIARRVFLPDELPGAPPLLPAQNSVAVSLRLSLSVGEAMPMAGYRALVFYP